MRTTSEVTNDVIAAALQEYFTKKYPMIKNITAALQPDGRWIIEGRLGDSAPATTRRRTTTRLPPDKPERTLSDIIDGA